MRECSIGVLSTEMLSSFLAFERSWHKVPLVDALSLEVVARWCLSQSASTILR